MKILCNGIELALATLVEIINLTFFTHYVTEQEIKYKIKTLCNVHSGNPCTGHFSRFISHFSKPVN